MKQVAGHTRMHAIAKSLALLHGLFLGQEITVKLLLGGIREDSTGSYCKNLLSFNTLALEHTASSEVILVPHERSVTRCDAKRKEKSIFGSIS
jgi:hypothetical protein